MSQLISPMFVNLAPRKDAARVRATLSCSFVISLGYDGDHPAPLRKSVRYGATCSKN
jgi:hypothetical protein